MVRDGDCGLELTEVPLVPQAASSTFSKGPPRPGPRRGRRCDGLKTEQQETRPPGRSGPAAPAPPRPASARCAGAGGRQLRREATRTLPSPAAEKRAREFIHRKRRAAPAARHPGGSAAPDGLGFGFAPSSLSSEPSPARAASVRTSPSPRGPRPSARARVRTPDPPPLRDLARSRAPPGLALASGERAGRCLQATPGAHFRGLQPASRTRWKTDLGNAGS